ncbi:MAG: OB-fold nucleic acid binding domain-containing protein [Candidatus Bathyarchaeia archaeon]
MAGVEEIIRKILSKNPKLSREEILKSLESEKMKTGGYVSDEILLQMIAARLGVEVPVEAAKTRILIENLVSGLSDVTIVGRVIAVFPAKSSGNDKGVKIPSLLVADKSGILRVVLWGDKAALVESGGIKVGQLVRFRHGYTREGSGGEVELHVGDRAEVEVDPSDVNPAEYPTIDCFSTKIGQITDAQKNKRIHVLGEVGNVSSVSTFKRQDQTSGKVMRFILEDETGRIPVVVWNDKVDEVEVLIKKGVRLQIVNAKVKKAVDGGFEVHVDPRTYVGPLEPADKLLKIGSLKEGIRNVSVQGQVVVKPILRDVKTSKGELVKLSVFEIEDETGRIWVSAWRKNAEKTADLKVGDKILVKNAYVKRGFGGQLEISTGNATSIEVLVKR